MNDNDAVEIFVIMQTNFNKFLCEELFPWDPVHFWVKWENSNGNIVTFLNNLDPCNQFILVEWGKTVLNEFRSM
jgi:hypothetical protein